MKQETTSELVAKLLATNDWKKIEEYFNNTDFINHLGITLSLDNPQRPKCMIKKISTIHLGGIGQDFINGAIISAILDLALGLTGLLYAKEGNFATTSLNIDITKPVKNGPFYAISKCNHKIGKTLFSEAIIYDCNDNPCVYATGKIKTALAQNHQ